MNEDEPVRDALFRTPVSPRTEVRGTRTQLLPGPIWRVAAGRDSSKRRAEEEEAEAAAAAGCWWRPGCMEERRGASPCRAAWSTTSRSSSPRYPRVSRMVNVTLVFTDKSHQLARRHCRAGCRTPNPGPRSYICVELCESAGSEAVLLLNSNINNCFSLTSV